MKPRYIPPTVEKITDEYIDSIAPLLMSCGGIDGGGGSGGGSSYRTIYMLNSEYGLWILGHSALLLERADKSVELFSFHPHDNQTGTPTTGSVATIANESEATSFATFRNVCRSNGGIVVDNAYTQWLERFNRYIELSISPSSYASIRGLANKRRANPPEYSAVSYNCQTFVNQLLAAGNVVLCSRGLSLYTEIVPNKVYQEADRTTTGVTYFGKGYL